MPESARRRQTTIMDLSSLEEVAKALGISLSAPKSRLCEGESSCVLRLRDMEL
jgi:hypothetical protein